MGDIVATDAQNGAHIASKATTTGGTPADPNFESQNADAVKNAIVGQLPDYLKSRKIIITFYEGTACIENVEVTVSGTYKIFFYHLMRLFGGNPQDITISRTTKMRYNYQLSTENPWCTTPSVDHKTYDIADA